MRSVLIILFTAFTTSVVAQKNGYQGFPSLVWPKLYNIRFEKGSDSLGDFDKPVFSNDTKALAGKNIILPGYIRSL